MRRETCFQVHRRRPLGEGERRACDECDAPGLCRIAHSDEPTLEQCYAFFPYLSSRRQTLWRTKLYDGVAAAAAIQPEVEAADDADEQDDEEAAEGGAAGERAQRDATVRAAAWRLLGTERSKQGTGVTAALRARLGPWRHEVRSAARSADLSLACKLFLEFLDGLLSSHLNVGETACINAALARLRGGNTRSATTLEADELSSHVTACWEALGNSARRQREASARQRRPFLLQRRQKYFKETQEDISLWNDWFDVRRCGLEPRLADQNQACFSLLRAACRCSE